MCYHVVNGNQVTADGERHQSPDDADVWCDTVPWMNESTEEIKWNESGFRPPLCTYRLNWARRTSWGWWNDWDDTFLQTQDSKFESWRSEAEHATSRSRKLPTILTFTRGWGRNIFVSFKPPRPGTEPRTLAWKAAVLTTTLGPPPINRGGYMDIPSLNEWNNKWMNKWMDKRMKEWMNKCLNVWMSDYLNK